MTSQPRADLAVIGGSGFYTFLDDAEQVRVETPFGDPSDLISVGTVGGRSVAFLPRHGRGHTLPPHLVNYRANLWALRSLGVRQVLGPCAVGSLRPDLTPGTVVIPDQVVDRTSGRASTVYDEVGPVVHVAFGDPYCPRGRRAVAASDPHGLSVVENGTLVVINGPRFSSRAESRWHQAAGWSLVGMTGMPEAAHARELAMCFTAVCLVTDHDAGVVEGQSVTHADVVAEFGRSIGHLKDMLTDTITHLPAAEPDGSATCSCRRALDGLRLPFDLPGDLPDDLPDGPQ